MQEMVRADRKMVACNLMDKEEETMHGGREGKGLVSVADLRRELQLENQKKAREGWKIVAERMYEKASTRKQENDERKITIVVVEEYEKKVSLRKEVLFGITT